MKRLAPTPYSERIPGSLNLALLGTAVSAATLLLWSASQADAWHWLIAAAIAFSFVNNTLFSLLHEAVHGQFHSHPLINQWAGRLAAAFFPTSYSMQRVFHLGHHQRNRTAVEQFDYLHPGDNQFFKYAQWYSILTGLYWCFVPLGCVVYFLAPWILRLPLLRSQRWKLAQQSSADAMFSDLEKASGAWIRFEVLLSAAVQALLFITLNLTWQGWMICYAAFALNWSALQYADHAWSPLDTRNGAWNLRVNRVVQYLFLNYHHHLAHHQFPEVSWLYLHRYVDPSAPRPRFLSVYLSMWRGPRPLPQETGCSEPLRGKISGQPTPTQDSDKVMSWRVRGVICLIVTALFYLVYAGANFVTSLHDIRIPLSFAFERQVPFVPIFAWIYVSLFFLMGLLPVVFTTKQDLWALALTLIGETVVAGVCFVLLPNEYVVAPKVEPGLTGALFNFADAVNLEHNLFPSLHVTFAWTTAILLGLHFSAIGRCALSLWAVALSSSTLLTHQHYLLDVVGGVVLALIGVKFYEYAKTPAFMRCFAAELTCLKFNYRFIRRHPRYLTVFLIIYGCSLFRWRRTRVVRFCYALAQHVDDVLDGDCSINGEPSLYVDRVIQQIRSRRFSDDELGVLARSVKVEFDRLETATDHPLAELIELFEVMTFDRRRVREQLLLTREELEQHHQQTFFHSVNLMLVGARAELRAGDAVDLIRAFGWCSTMRDLEEDLARGLVNIPCDVIAQAQTQGARDSSYGSLTRTAAVRQWIRLFHDEGKQHLERFAMKYALIRGKKGARILDIFFESMCKFHTRYIKSHPEFFHGEGLSVSANQRLGFREKWKVS